MDRETQLLIESWDWSYLDLDPAFEGLSREGLHARVSPNVLSIAENAAHTIYSEASIILRYLLGVPREEWGDSFVYRPPYGWPPDVVLAASNPELLSMSVADVKEMWLAEHKRFRDSLQEFSLPASHRFEDSWSDAAPDVATRLRFAAYHVSYHVGQIFLIRSILGEEGPDN